MSDDLLITSVQQSLAAKATGDARQGLRSNREAREAAESFEAMFIAQMFNHMFSGLKTDGMFGGGHAEGVYRSMQAEQYAKATARAGGIGIADAVYQELLKFQDVTQQDPTNQQNPIQGATP